MTKTKAKALTREERKIAELAREYRSLGYEVQALTHGFESPPRFAGALPDLVVKKGDQTVIIEVETKGTAVARTEAVAQLSKYAQMFPNVRFDLVVTNRKQPSKNVDAYHQSTVRSERVLARVLLNDIERAISVDRADLAILLEAALMQFLLVRRGTKRGVLVRDEIQLGALADRLAKEHAISGPTREFVASLNAFRNAVMHGRAPSPSLAQALSFSRKIESYADTW